MSSDQSALFAELAPPPHPIQPAIEHTYQGKKQRGDEVARQHVARLVISFDNPPNANERNKVDTDDLNEE